MTTGAVGFIAAYFDEVRNHYDRFVGILLYWTWNYIAFWSDFTVSPGLSPLALLGRDQLWTISLSMNVLTLLIIFVASRWKPAITNNRALLYCGYMLMSFAAVSLILVGTVPTGFDGYLFMLGACFSGIGTGIVLAFWGELFGTTSPRIVLFDMASTALFGSLIYMVFIFLPIQVAQGALIAFPFASALLLSCALSRSGSVPIRAPRKKNHGWWELALLSVAIGISLGLMRGLANPVATGGMAEDGIAYASGLGISGILLFVTIIFFRHDNQFGLVYRVTFPLIAAAFFLLPVFSDNPAIALMVHTIGFSYFHTFLWVLCADFSQRTSFTPLQVFSGSLFAAQSGQIIGTFIGNKVGPATELSGVGVSLISLAVVYLFLMVFVSLLVRKEKEKPQRVLDTLDEEVEFYCHKIAEQKCLTPREQEILMMLARHQSRASICEKLAISQDTLKVHIRHIYTKLDIHSKQELSAAFENARQSDNQGL